MQRGVCGPDAADCRQSRGTYLAIAVTHHSFITITINIIDAMNKNSHLVVFVHGLWGNHTHVSKPYEALEERYKRDEEKLSHRLDTLLAKANEGDLTYDGIDIMATRLVQEIQEKIKEIEKEGIKVDQFSIIGYSLGGLVSRYAIGILYTQKFFDDVTPVSFTTFCSPHLGSYQSDWKGLRGWMNQLGSKMLSRSGEQLFVQDKWENEKPLLAHMATPGTSFHTALTLFQYRRLYTAVANDQTVPYWTGSATGLDPFVEDIEKLEMNYDKDYPSVLTSYIPTADKGTKVAISKDPVPFKEYARKTGIYVWFGVFIPIALPLFLTIATVKVTRDGYRSRRRIEAVMNGQKPDAKSVHIGNSKMNDMLTNALDEVAAMNGGPELVAEGDKETREANNTASASATSTTITASSSSATLDSNTTLVTGNLQNVGKRPELLPAQLEMVEGLKTNLSWERYAVKVPAWNAHGVVVVRFNFGPRDEAMIGLKHFADKFALS